MQTLTETPFMPENKPHQFQYRNLVDNSIWNRLVGRIMKDHNLSREASETIMEGTLGFLKLCADFPERKFAPSKFIDIGWHTFLLYTKSYTSFCMRHAGRFIHHEPNDNPQVQEKGGGVRDTISFMENHGIIFDPVLWERNMYAADCKSQCTVDCRDDCWNCSSDK